MDFIIQSNTHKNITSKLYTLVFAVSLKVAQNLIGFQKFKNTLMVVESQVHLRKLIVNL